MKNANGDLSRDLSPIPSTGPLRERIRLVKRSSFRRKKMARATGLEPATSGVTGRHSNRLSYARALNRRSGVEAVYEGL